DGADLVCFSGDKLFGGPQAGIIAGKKRFVAALKHEPVFRALRCDKLVFAALQATVDLHLNQSTPAISALALLQVSEQELRARAAASRSDCRPAAEFRGTNRNWSRHSQNRRWHFAKVNEALSDNRHCSAELLALQFCRLSRRLKSSRD